MSSQASTQGGKSIFISYRREDSQDVTGRIYDRLHQKFGHAEIFKDVDSIPIGEDFRKHLDQQLRGCRVLLAIIGPQWAENPRLQEETDFVRIEIEQGLEPERDILVVPVLVGNTSIPSDDQLPDTLTDLAFRHAHPVRPDPDFNGDIDKLINWLTDKVGIQPAEEKSESQIKQPTCNPYKLHGKEYFDPKGLALGLKESWASGVKQLERGLVTEWIRRDFQDQGMFSELTDLAEDPGLDSDQRLSLALLILDEGLPLFWKGEEINPEWLTGNPKETVAFLEEPLPEWVQKMKGDSSYLDIRRKREEALARIEAIGVPVNRDMVDDLLILAFASPEKFHDRFQQIWAELHPEGGIAEAEDARVDALLKKEELGLEEGVVLLACDQTTFLVGDPSSAPPILPPIQSPPPEINEPPLIPVVTAPEPLESPIQPAAPKKNLGKIVKVLGVIGILILCGIGGCWYFAEYTDEQSTRGALEKTLTIQQRIGRIHTIDLSFTLTTTGPERDGEFIYSIQGEKGGGVVSVNANLAKEIVLSGFLELPDGKKYDLITGDPIP